MASKKQPKDLKFGHAIAKPEREYCRVCGHLVALEWIESSGYPLRLDIETGKRHLTTCQPLGRKSQSEAS